MGCPGGSTWRLVTIGKGNKEGRNGQLGKGNRANGQSGKGKAPRGFLGACGGFLVDQLPARADRINRRVNNRQRARYPITRKRGFMGSKEDMHHRTIGKPPSNESPFPRVL